MGSGGKIEGPVGSGRIEAGKAEGWGQTAISRVEAGRAERWVDTGTIEG